MTGRSELMYSIVLHKPFVLLHYHLMPSVSTVDFEKGMLNKAQYHFPMSKISHCLYHFKQELFIKMNMTHFLKDEISPTLRHIDLITVLDPEQIKNVIEFIKIYADQKDQCWSAFLVYFSCI
ncbi:hypothetical protein MXB_4439 [Myxobolus squamalis]|nr:hypothetical protein MXB_4439 [Myxobolus squamalis]